MSNQTGPDNGTDNLRRINVRIDKRKHPDALLIVLYPIDKEARTVEDCSLQFNIFLIAYEMVMP